MDVECRLYGIPSSPPGHFSAFFENARSLPKLNAQALNFSNICTQWNVSMQTVAFFGRPYLYTFIDKLNTNTPVIVWVVLKGYLHLGVVTIYFLSTIFLNKIEKNSLPL